MHKSDVLRGALPSHSALPIRNALAVPLKQPPRASRPRPSSESPRRNKLNRSSPLNPRTTTKSRLSNRTRLESRPVLDKLPPMKRLTPTIQSKLHHLRRKGKPRPKVAASEDEIVETEFPIHAEGETPEHQILREFDLTYEYGPCIGMSRIERWERADRMGLNPPQKVYGILQQHDTADYLQCCFARHGRF
ncbi:hypothetical protein BDZ89DRAFT_115153 [Hymenopellis radicata]|nr:hypothetical protein BDZ89DRAFT_115153 [Hymenopellis radicata]